MPNLECPDRWDLGGLEVQGPGNGGERRYGGHLAGSEKTYDAGGIGPAVVESIIKRWFRCCEMGYDRVSGAVRAPRHPSQRLATTKTWQKKRTRE